MLPTLLAAADTVQLKNGDRYSGDVLRSDAKDLVLKTEFAGTVTIQWDAVTSITAGQPLTLSLKDGQTVVGTVTTSGDQFIVATRETGQVTAARASVQAIRNADEQRAYEAQIDRFRNPSLLDLWSGFVDTGFARSAGNSRTSAFNLGVNAARATPRDKIGVYATSIRASNSTTGIKVRTANASRGGARYELNLTEKVFAFGFTDIEADEFQNLDLRVAPGGGFGYHLYKKEKNFFDLFGGASYNREFFFNNIDRSAGEILFGNELGYQFNQTFGVTEKFVIFPNLSDGGEFRMNFDASAITRVAKWLSWQLTVSDRYLSLPVAGAKKNDMLFTTGVRVTFTK
jgi:putative salt-induced outer membrane protein YdiY